MAAAVALHVEQGIVGTSWEEIASRAGVAPSTIYRHFPDLDALIPACTRAEFEAGAQLPKAEELVRAFPPGVGTAERVDVLIGGSCRCYERGDAWLEVARGEAHLVSALGEAKRLQLEALRLLIRTALGGATENRPTDRRVEAALLGLLDYPTWKALREAGIPASAIPPLLGRLARTLNGSEEGAD
ncbi:MAG TPA: helix-turn-helix domain-containing protein [Candidatus Limnocylindria bacterium]|nr:helix-turn-helix domain-containing protein [Candidatus Limnocylindria bacterium]